MADNYYYQRAKCFLFKRDNERRILVPSAVFHRAAAIYRIDYHCIYGDAANR